MIPIQNVDNLQLSDDIIEVVKNGEFIFTLFLQLKKE